MLQKWPKLSNFKPSQKKLLLIKKTGGIYINSEQITNDHNQSLLIHVAKAGSKQHMHDSSKLDYKPG